MKKKKQQIKTKKREEKKRQKRVAEAKGKNVLFQIARAIYCFFPDLLERLANIDDPRTKKKKGKLTYKIEEIVMAAVGMYLLKEGSRNATNNDKMEGKFVKNFKSVFRCRLPHMDTVDAVLRELRPEELEKLKTTLIQTLLRKKVFHRFRFLGKYFLIAVDATGEVSFDIRHCDQCTYRVYNRGKKNEKTKYFHNVLEAKLVCPNGISVSIATEYIENAQEEYKKQDCELKAFRRLAPKIKKFFSRLPICLVGDALYANQTVFSICRQNKWSFIVNQKDKTLPSLWNDVKGLQKIEINNSRREIFLVKNVWIERKYVFINDIDYHGHKLCQVECIETKHEADKESTTRFVYLSNEKISRKNVISVVQAGRNRWKIENQGFNEQKNHGYGLGHKFSRVSYIAMKNYYQCLQIAHIINQLVTLSCYMRDKLLQWKTTLKHLWEKALMAFLIAGKIVEAELERFKRESNQFRLI